STRRRWSTRSGRSSSSPTPRTSTRCSSRGRRSSATASSSAPTSTPCSRSSTRPGTTSSARASCCRTGQPSRRPQSDSRPRARSGPAGPSPLQEERMAGTVLIVGGTQGLGRELAQAYADDGRDVVVTGRDAARAETAAGEIGGSTRGIGFDLADPHSIDERLADVGDVDYLVLAAIERGTNKVQEYDIESALRLVTLKLVGYTHVI